MIGIFDSGLGGLTVLWEILNLHPSANIIYIGDTARIPWGSKKPETIRHYSTQLTRYLLKKGADSIIVACHTASSVALDEVKSQAKGLSVTGMILPSAKDAVKITKNKKIAILGTKTTIASNAWGTAIKKLDPGINIFSTACPLFVPIVEEDLIDHQVASLMTRHYLESLKKVQVDTVVLACTHYPFLQKPISDFLGPGVRLINPGKSVARELRPKTNQLTNKINLYFTDQPSPDNNFLSLIQERPGVTINSVPLEEIEHE